VTAAHPPLAGEQFSVSGPGSSGPVDEKPTPARVYDYLLGGKDNYLPDREFGERLKVAQPDVVAAVLANRAFLGRAVTYAARQGVDQFVDIGTGLPTTSNVHEIAQKVNPAARVVYVDNDPVVVAHGQALLSEAGATTTMLHADLRDPEAIFTDPDLLRLIDLDEQVAVVLNAVLHFVPDEHDPHGITDRVRRLIGPGSYLVVSHAVPAPGVAEVEAMYTAEATAPGVARTPAQIARFFKGLDLVPPGVVSVGMWRPERGTVGEDVWVHGGVGRKP
jgi:S-adenosyl methyltransferase